MTYLHKCTQIKNHPGKTPQTVWRGGRIMYDNADADDDYDDDDEYDDDDDGDDDDDYYYYYHYYYYHHYY